MNKMKLSKKKKLFLRSKKLLLKSILKKKRLLLTPVMLAGLLHPGFALARGGGACRSSRARISISARTLNFASMAACSAASSGHVAVNAATGGRAATGCVYMTPAGGYVRARVRVRSRQSRRSDTIYVRLSSRTGTIAVGGNHMNITGLKLYRATGSPTASGGYSQSGSARKTYYVGGKLNVSAHQSAGSYTGSFTITATCF